MLSDNKRPHFLLVSFFLIATAFQYSFVIIQGDKTFNGGGTLGPDIRITVALILTVLISPFIKIRKNVDNKSYWVKTVGFFILIALLNPFNHSFIPTLAFIIFFLTHIILFELFYSFLNKDELIKAIFDAFFMLCMMQFPLAVCFPFLGMKSVTLPFQDAAERLATRDGQRDGAVGIFIHPGYLALFMVMTSAFFLACYLSRYKRNTSLFILIINTLTLILTYSRTAYLVHVFDLFAVYFIFKNAKSKLFSIVNLFRFVLPISIIITWVIFFSPLSDNFLNSNVDSMAESRLIFYYMAFEIFKFSPFIGVGLNTHRDFLISHGYIIRSLTKDPFYFNNPIHNVHLIVLVENGIIGFICWLVFLFRSFFRAKNDVADNKNIILSLTLIGVIIGYAAYGMTGWAPFSATMLPFLLFFAFFTIRYRGTIDPHFN